MVKLFKNARVFSTFEKIYKPLDFAVENGRIIYIAPSVDPAEYPGCAVVDLDGKYAAPGFIDIHMHIESSMTTPGRFSETVLGFGTTAVVADPHEIANVFGLEGVEAFIAQDTLLDIYYGAPSSVPTLDSAKETAGGAIGVAELKKLLANRRVICLGEVMNFGAVVGKEPSNIKDLIKTVKEFDENMPIEGHCPRLSGKNLAAMIAGGVDSDHTLQTAESVVEKVNAGMFVEIQEKSATREVIQAVCENNLYDYVCFCTDDVMPDHLMHGHLNTVAQKAIEYGMSPEMAVYCSTYTPSKRMRLTSRGFLAPGRLADFILLDDPAVLKPSATYKNGELFVQKSFAPQKFPEKFYRSVLCKKAQAGDLRIPACGAQAVCNVLVVNSSNTTVGLEQRTLPVKDGAVDWVGSGLALLAVFERHGKNANIGLALVSGTLDKRGAVASTWSHDCHNLCVLGTDIEDMLLAQHDLVNMQGGYVAWANKSRLGGLPLPIAGILSDEPIEKTKEQLAEVRAAMEALGYRHYNSIMSFATLALPVSPEYKLTDFGIIRVADQSFVPAVERTV